jgi:hypothetical protein
MIKETIAYISIVLFIFSLVSFSILSSRVKVMKPYKKASTFYVLIGGVVFALSSLFSLVFTSLSWIWVFIFLVLFYSGLGLAHQYFGGKILPWTRKARLFWVFLYSLIISALGSIGYMWGFYFLSETSFTFTFLIFSSFFFLPLFIVKTYFAYFEIPKRDFKKWFYPVGQPIDDPSDRELEAPFVITFEFEKKFDDLHLTSFRAKAPRYMKFGRLFYFFINDYNGRHPESKIEFIYDKSKPFGWIFYTRPYWYGGRYYIDHEATVMENKIEENSVIYCKRVIDDVINTNPYDKK